MKLKKVKISDLGRVVTGNTPPRKQPDLYGDVFPFIKPTDIELDSRYTLNPEECYSQKGYEKYIKSLIPKGSTCVVTIGSIGKKITMAHTDCFINQAMNAVVPTNGYDANYIFYLLKLNLNKVKALDSGTSSGRENVSKSSFSSMEVEIHDDYNTQQHIASILSAYDDLIETNLRRIKLLEEAVRYEYKMLIEGGDKWNKVPIQEVLGYYIGGGWGEESSTGDFTQEAFVIRGTDIPGNKFGDISSVPLRFHKEGNLSSRKLMEGDIVFEVSGGSKTSPIGRSLLMNRSLLNQYGADVMCASFCKLIRRNQKVTSEYLYLFLVESFYDGSLKPYERPSASNIINFAFETYVEEAMIKLPPQDDMNIFSEKARSYLDMIAILGSQITLLRQARDILLPKLMSGEIEVE